MSACVGLCVFTNLFYNIVVKSMNSGPKMPGFES